MEFTEFRQGLECLMYRKLFSMLKPRTLIITANRRLALSLQRELKEHPAHPQVETIETWINQLWMNYRKKSARLLSDFEEGLLWQEILSKHLHQYPLLDIADTAKLAQQAWRSLLQWDKDLSALESRSSPETLNFVTWAREFQTLCQERDYRLHPDLIHELIELCHRGTLKLSTIVLLGFDEPPPLYQRFFKALEQASDLLYGSNNSSSTQPLRLCLPELKAEIQLMARWAKAQLAQYPDQHIACVVPELNRLRDNIQQSFSELFETELFNISIGRPLTRFKLIHSALSALALNHHSFELAALSEILRSSYINFKEEDALLAAELDLALRENNSGFCVKRSLMDFSLNRLREKYPEASFPERWHSFYTLWGAHKTKRLPSEWGKAFTQELQALGWPGQRELDAEEIQLMEDWQTLLLEYAELDFMGKDLKRNEALKILNQLAAQHMFQAENKAMPIQILGSLEASGLSFDALWIMGLNDRCWPAMARPNPFIPYHQQREWKMPHASNERELDYTQGLQKHLLQSAKTIIVSSSQLEAETKLSPSPLIRNFPEIKVDTFISNYSIQAHIPKARLIFDSRLQEHFEDDQAPIVTKEDIIKGGSFILKEQALCPFRAFAHLRLKAHSIPEAEWGLSAMSKGSFVHRALELFWKNINSQDELSRLSSEQLKTAIEKAVRQSLKGSPEEAAFLEIEQKRLTQQLQEWIELEKRRAPFKVLAIESAYKIDLGGLSLKLRIDRIDELEDGSYLIIDYKTGHTQIGHWLEERIQEPQLPLYCSFAFTGAEAIAFAELKKGSLRFRGISADETEIDGIIPVNQLRYEPKIPSWSTLTQTWKKHLTQTAKDFCAGKAAVDPCDQSACDHCDLQALCRVNEVSE